MATTSLPGQLTFAWERKPPRTPPPHQQYKHGPYHFRPAYPFIQTDCFYGPDGRLHRCGFTALTFQTWRVLEQPLASLYTQRHRRRTARQIPWTYVRGVPVTQTVYDAATEFKTIRHPR